MSEISLSNASPKLSEKPSEKLDEPLNDLENISSKCNSEGAK